jgi:PAS domain-containing protein
LTELFDRLLRDANPDALIVTTLADVVAYWNPGAEEMFDNNAKDAVGLTITERLYSSPGQAVEAVHSWRRPNSMLFREFDQLEFGSIRHCGGTGLGLVLTKNIVDLQRGSFSVRSEGGTFCVVLPLEAA